MRDYAEYYDYGAQAWINDDRLGGMLAGCMPTPVTNVSETLKWEI
jgi:hypothetical protein